MAGEKDLLLDYISPILMYIALVAVTLLSLIGIICILDIGEVAAWILIEGMTIFMGLVVQTTTESLE